MHARNSGPRSARSSGDRLSVATSSFFHGHLGLRYSAAWSKSDRCRTLAATITNQLQEDVRATARKASGLDTASPLAARKSRRSSSRRSRERSVAEELKVVQPRGIRFVPVTSLNSQLPRTDQQPFMMILPDIDGVGVTSSRAWKSIATRFQLQVLNFDSNFTGSFAELTSCVASRLLSTLRDVPQERPVYLLGEGFGSVLALAVVLACKGKVVNRLVLVNPATCIRDVPIRRIGPLLTRLPRSLMNAAPLGILPLLGGSPTDLVGHMMADARSDRDNFSPASMAAAAMKALLNTLEQLQQLSVHLPPETLKQRLELLDEGLRHVQGSMSEVPLKTMIIAGGRDALLPSADEAARLERLLPRAFSKVLPNAGHALLLDPNVDLISLMEEEGFYTTKRTFTSRVKAGMTVQYGAAGPVELPNQKDVERAGKELTTPLRRLSSPVFLSTTPEGKVIEGLDGVDFRKRPLLFVGNHQLYAMDMNILVEEIYQQKGVLLRGLAHPAIFQQTSQHDAPVTETTTQAASKSPQPIAQNSIPTQHVQHTGTGNSMNNIVTGPNIRASPDSHGSSSGGDNRVTSQHKQGMRAPSFLGNMYQTFGAVPVSGTAFFRLLAAQEAVLLYPGGVREGFKRKDEKYQLFWPEKSEFVRMAAKHNAIVIPVSAVGWEDCIRIVMDTDEIASHTVLGPMAREASLHTPKVRDSDSSDTDQMFIPPLIAPDLTSRDTGRMYFLLGKPVALDPSLCHDRPAADAVYSQIRDTVKSGMDWLLERRDQDPYRDVVKRLMYENSLGRRQAPTFPLE